MTHNLQAAIAAPSQTNRAPIAARLAGATLLLVVCQAPALRAQSSLTTDVLDAGARALQVDAFAHLARRSEGGYQWYMPQLLLGVGHGLEVGAGYSAYAPHDSTAFPTIMPSIKWRFASRGERFSAAIGMAGSIAAEAGRTDRWGFAYALTDTRIAERGPMLTTGGFTYVGRAEGQRVSGGIIVSAAQPIGSSIELGTEWVSGEHFFGALSPNVTLSHGRRWLTIGYSIGSDGPAGSGPTLQYGFSF